MASMSSALLCLIRLPQVTRTKVAEEEEEEKGLKSWVWTALGGTFSIALLSVTV
jgi:hypothetical protein